MASTNDSPPSDVQRRPRSRKSTGHLPSPDTYPGSTDQENVGSSLDKDSHILHAEELGTGRKRLRSKSLGPGGVDALREDAGNRRKVGVVPIIKSILKPPIPLSPLREIPTRKVASPRKSPAKTSNSPAKSGATSGILIAFSAADNGSPRRNGGTSASVALPDPFGSGAVVCLQPERLGLRTEQEQQTAAREREENEKRKRDKDEIIRQRDERRKSMANRRVSFAPEATLHTWDVVEYMQDSTTSSASTNTTRRASAITASTPNSPHPALQSQAPSSDLAETPSTPPAQAEPTALVVESPAHQRDLHQKKRRRRSSAIPPMILNDPEDALSSSPCSGSSATGSDTTVLQGEGEELRARLKNEAEEEHMDGLLGLGNEDNTNHSAVSSESSGSSTESSGRLDEALRQAAAQAGTRGIDYDENGDLSMEMAEDEVTAALKPWLQHGVNPSHRLQYLSSLEEQENVNPFSPAFKASLTGASMLQVDEGTNDDEEMSMEVTRAIGSIIPTAPRGQTEPMLKNKLSQGRQSTSESRRTSRRSSAFGDEAIELTTAVGGIQQPSFDQDNAEAADEDEDEDAGMSMDLTTAFGAIGPFAHDPVRNQDRNPKPKVVKLADKELINDVNGGSTSVLSEDDEMEMITALGAIVGNTQNPVEPSNESTMEMDLTTAIGLVVPEHLSINTTAQARALMEQEADGIDMAFSPIQLPTGSPKKAARPTMSPKNYTPTGSPSKSRGRSRRNSQAKSSSAPLSSSRQVSTPEGKLTTPAKQLTPQLPLARPTTPGKTPPMMNVTMRTASPKNLLKEFIKQSASTPNPSSPRLFSNSDTDVGPIPPVVLTPRPRRASGLGIDKEGLGSPRVAAMLDRRRSIGEEARGFAAQSLVTHGVRFDDPRIMKAEIEKERAQRERERRESGRSILEQEADGHEEVKDATLNLKEMIGSLTPKQNKLKGRKSLAVGGAKGLLGKRPLELDEDDEEDHTPMRLRGREASPVKRIRLQAPPSMLETTGKPGRPSRKSADVAFKDEKPITPLTNVSPLKDLVATTPRSQGRFKDVETIVSPPKFEVEGVSNVEIVQEEQPTDERIHLQDFLNMMNIRFMELNTTKRRHTAAPTSMKDTNGDTACRGDISSEDAYLESCVVAGACTVPMLELYQHSCRELKKYISEGRDIVSEIEADTYAENPPLFREYITASPETKFIMHNQFKNVRTHARLQSKKMWYQWRLVLLDGLKEGLAKIAEGMVEDDAALLQQEDLLASVLPGLIYEDVDLRRECVGLQNEAVVLDASDPTELEEARQRLVSVEEEIEQKRKMLVDVRGEYDAATAAIELAAERKIECTEEIRESERVREECRGWSVDEVAALKASVDALQSAHGWTILSSSSTTVTMLYDRELQLFFDTAAFLPNSTTGARGQASNKPNSPISLTHVDNHRQEVNRGSGPSLSTEKRFFLQLMRAHLQCVQQSKTRIADLLSFVSTGWRRAVAVAEEVRRLKRGWVTDVDIVSDERMVVKCMVLLEELRTRVDVCFGVEVAVAVARDGGKMELEVVVRPGVEVRYGEGFDEAKMGRFLEERVGGEIKEVVGAGRFERAVEELRGLLGRRGRKR